MEGPHWLQERKRLIKRCPGFWRNLPPISRGFRVVDAMREVGYRFAVLTKASRKVPAAWAGKVLWCDEHLHDAEVIVAEGKSLVYGRVLFDDWPPYVESWIEWRPRGLVVMLDQPHNRAFTHPRVLRYYGDGTLEPVEAEREKLLRRLREVLPTPAR